MYNGARPFPLELDEIFKSDILSNICQKLVLDSLDSFWNRILSKKVLINSVLKENIKKQPLGDLLQKRLSSLLVDVDIFIDFLVSVILEKSTRNTRTVIFLPRVYIYFLMTGQNLYIEQPNNRNFLVVTMQEFQFPECSLKNSSSETQNLFFREKQLI